ncbi:hypothetical protein AB0H57_30015 [Micromonospora sp. NPDC050686]|uniref:hypothetical protein n=1 Tax=Micromonospora sp. NPDC050686 TaxID=3154631 RepID=UPI0033DC71B9
MTETGKLPVVPLYLIRGRRFAASSEHKEVRALDYLLDSTNPFTAYTIGLPDRGLHVGVLVDPLP